MHQIGQIDRGSQTRGTLAQRKGVGRYIWLVLDGDHKLLYRNGAALCTGCGIINSIYIISAGRQATPTRCRCREGSRIGRSAASRRHSSDGGTPSIDNTGLRRRRRRPRHLVGGETYKTNKVGGSLIRLNRYIHTATAFAKGLRSRHRVGEDRWNGITDGESRRLRPTASTPHPTDGKCEDPTASARDGHAVVAGIEGHTRKRGGYPATATHNTVAVVKGFLIKVKLGTACTANIFGKRIRQANRAALFDNADGFAITGACSRQWIGCSGTQICHCIGIKGRNAVLRWISGAV